MNLEVGREVAFFMDRSKNQAETEPRPDNLPPDVLISPDTLRAERLPPGQSRTLKWPVLDASGPPVIDLRRWRCQVSGLVARPQTWTWEEFQKLPRVKVFSDFHCVTRWSRLGNLWDGVSTRELIERCGGVLPSARYALIRAYDGGWTTNLPLDDLLAEDSVVALGHDGSPLPAEHGGPARLVVPRLYAWKSAKWISGIELLDQDRAGFWERNGYHMRGDPWAEERHSW